MAVQTGAVGTLGTRSQSLARVLALALTWWLTMAVVAGAADRDRLVWHAEAADGTVVWSRGADTAVNPASVVKVGTAAWAIERLGIDHRYVTRIGIRGEFDPATGVVAGAVVVAGGGDPDLQPENAFLIAAELNRRGVRRATGGLVVVPPFDFGWDRGVDGRRVADGERLRRAGERLVAALDPSRWSTTLRHTWQALAARRGLAVETPPGVAIAGAVTVAATVDARWLAGHRSNPLPIILRRFNVYSNNDVVRVAAGLGGAGELQSYLRTRLAAPHIELATASGEERNRMTPREAVCLVGLLAATTRSRGLEPRAVLPVLGCDPGPTRRMFPRFLTAERAGGVTVKTGTLSTTDGGVAVLAGLFTAADGCEIRFCVAAPRAGGDLRHWRALEQSWLEELISRTGGLRLSPCPPELPFSDHDALVESLAPDAKQTVPIRPVHSVPATLEMSPTPKKELRAKEGARSSFFAPEVRRRDLESRSR